MARKPQDPKKRNAKRGSKRKPAATKAAPPPGRRWARSLLKWLAVTTIWLVVAMGGLAAWYAYDLPDVSRLGERQRTPSLSVRAADGSLLARSGDLYAAPLRADEIPPVLAQAVIAIEDRRFYSHFGLDPVALLRAVVANLRAGGVVQGGSTLTQQLAKNVFLTPARTFKRKAQEVLLALWLERKFSKDQILAIYLNRVYLGAGAYGVAAAARRYFGKPARDLTLAEAAIIAGLLKAPSRYAPTRDLARSRARARQVLAAMVAAGFITEAEAEAAAKAPVHLARVRGGGRGARYFVDWVRDRVAGFVGAGAGDLIVETTLEPRLQAAAEAAVAKGLAAAAKRDAGQAALVAITPDGAVRAMVGGRDYGQSQFNRVVQARRQPGSAFKLFVYLAALEAGIAPDDTVADAPLTIDGWSPRNFNGRYAGQVSLRDAFARSLNTAAVRLSERVGRARVIAMARRLGITGRLPSTPSLALGTAEVTPLELVAAYATLANRGLGVWPHAISAIRDGSGRVLYRRQGSGPGRVLTPATTRAMIDLLAAVVARGTGKAAAIGRPAAGKTGTSQAFRDAWFVGFSRELVAAVWVGNDDGAPTDGITGGGIPARVWARFMKAALAGDPPRPLALPADVPAPAPLSAPPSPSPAKAAASSSSPGETSAR